MSFLPAANRLYASTVPCACVDQCACVCARDVLTRVYACMRRGVLSVGMERVCAHEFCGLRARVCAHACTALGPTCVCVSIHACLTWSYEMNHQPVTIADTMRKAVTNSGTRSCFSQPANSSLDLTLRAGRSHRHLPVPPSATLGRSQDTTHMGALDYINNIPWGTLARSRHRERARRKHSRRQCASTVRRRRCPRSTPVARALVGPHRVPSHSLSPPPTQARNRHANLSVRCLFLGVC